MEIVVLQPGSGGFDHRGRATEVDIGVACGEHPLIEQVGDEADRAVPLLIRASDDDVYVETGHPPLEHLQFVELAEVGDRGDSVQQTDRCADVSGKAFGHRKNRRQAGAAGHQDHRTYDGTQIDCPCCIASDPIPRFRAVAQIIRHHAVCQKADDEFEFVAAIGRTGI